MERSPGLNKSREMGISIEILGLILLSHLLQGKNSASHSVVTVRSNSCCRAFLAIGDYSLKPWGQTNPSSHDVLVARYLIIRIELTNTKG